MTYQSNKSTRAKIDKLLERNAQIVANFGTKGKFDVRTKTERDKQIRVIMRDIKELDEALYKIIKRQDD